MVSVAAVAPIIVQIMINYYIPKHSQNKAQRLSKSKETKSTALRIYQEAHVSFSDILYDTALLDA
jgi:uncharacterized membrane-anchored protein YitT (DUF2179 family)